jgi:hypothetical protein
MNITTLTLHILICMWFTDLTTPSSSSGVCILIDAVTFFDCNTFTQGHCSQCVPLLNPTMYGTRKNSLYRMVYSHKHSSKVAIIALLLSGDVHPNPGPVRYPCGVCANPVAQNHYAVCCDSCDRWVHIRCAGISQAEYER